MVINFFFSDGFQILLEFHSKKDHQIESNIDTMNLNGGGYIFTNIELFTRDAVG